MTSPDGRDPGQVEDGLHEFGFLSTLSLRVEESQRGRTVIRVPYDDSLANPPGPDGTRPLHGGIVATAVDVAGISTVGSMYDEATGATTVELNVSYLRPATGDVIATGEIVRAGRTVGVARVTAETETDDGRVEVAAGRVSCRVFQD